MSEGKDSAEVREEIARRGPSSGGYYWFPRRELGVLSWKVLTCHDLGCGAEVGHIDLWSSVIDRLADLWRRDRRVLARHLKNHYTGLPRGRVTEPNGRFLVCHGNDAPVGNWKTRVRRAFGLDACPLKAIFDEHEHTLEDDRRIVEETLGIAIGPATSRPNRRERQPDTGRVSVEEDIS